MTGEGAVRNLEQIQEQDPDTRVPRGVTLAFVALGGACVVFAALALGGRRAAAPVRVDPLGDLVAQRGHAAPTGAPGTAAGAAVSGARATDLAPRDVTFPGILSDGEHPTTALAAVRGGAASAPPVLSPGAAGGSDTARPRGEGSGAAATGALVPVSPPAAGDKLPVVPLPAQQVLEASPVVTRPRDALTKAATDSGQVTAAAAPSVAAGHEGGYQLQVSSFRSKDEANDFNDQLRARGHKSYVQEAHVPGRGTWYRVRVGPFPTQHAAAAYRSSFEQKEHVVPFVVQPTTKDAVKP